jgi:hypothetical protein
MGSNYSVKQIVEVTKIGVTGDLERFNRITAITARGTRFTLDVAEAQTTKEHVDKLLSAKAKELDSIMG